MHYYAVKEPLDGKKEMASNRYTIPAVFEIDVRLLQYRGLDLHFLTFCQQLGELDGAKAESFFTCACDACPGLNCRFASSNTAHKAATTRGSCLSSKPGMPRVIRSTAKSISSSWLSARGRLAGFATDLPKGLYRGVAEVELGDKSCNHAPAEARSLLRHLRIVLCGAELHSDNRRAYQPRYASKEMKAVSAPK